MVLIYCDQRRSTVLNPVLGLVEIKVIVNISLSREESGNEIGMTSPVACNVALLCICLCICLFVFVRATRMVMAMEMRATWIEISE